MAVEAARALIIASSTRNITVKSLSGQAQSWPLVTGNALYNERQWAAGAGGVDAGRMSLVMNQQRCTTPGHHPGGSYGGVTVDFDPDNPPGVTKIPVETGHAQGSIRCRLAIAWNPLPNCSGAPPNVSCTDGQGFDFDLCLTHGPTGQLMGCASSWENNYEYMNVPCYPDTWYWVEIYPFWGTPHNLARLGWALAATGQ